jgi:integrase-like protein
MSVQDQSRTDSRVSMPRRSKTPGLKRGRHNLYWIAKQVVRDPLGFPDRCIALPADADGTTLATLCQEYTARLLKWIADQRSHRFDGTVLSACQLYQTHPNSHFHQVKHNTRKTYTDSLKLIERTVGPRLIRNLTVLDVDRWYREWRKPKTEGKAERVDRAHDAVSMFRTVLRFCAALRHPACKQLADELKLVQFERGGARTEEMTFAQASKFVRTALELGSREVIPADRARYMAIGVAAQFELLLRQKDIIGEWRPDNTWAGFFTWENIPGWRWRMKTSKSKYRAAAEFDLTSYGLLLPLLEDVPHAERVGAIVKGEHGHPIRERSYRKWFRQIARAAGIPDTVWSMDSRAGGATEAQEAGADLDAIRDALTHTETRTTARYIRRRSSKIADVAQARNRKRSADEGGGTA